MKHTLKAKYASDGIQAHRQRVMATVPVEVARIQANARRQEAVDRVSARFAESARPKHDNLSTATMFSMTALDALKRQLARDYAKLGAQLASYGTRQHDDQLDAVRYASMVSPRCVGKSPFPIIMDDITC